MPFLDFLKKKKDERAELVQEFHALLTAKFPGAAMTETGAMQFQLQGGGLSTMTVFLENLFRQLQGSDEDRTSHIKRHFDALVAASAEEAPVFPDQIVPTIKDQMYLDQLGGDRPLATEHLVADLWIVYAVDLPDRIATFKPEVLDTLKLPREHLRRLAIDNLMKILPPVEQHGEGDWFLVTAGGDYTASVLLLDHIWDALEGEVQGDLVVAAPSRDVLLVTGSGSAAGIAAVRSKAIEIEQGGSYAVSQTLLRRREGKWIAFN